MTRTTRGQAPACVHCGSARCPTDGGLPGAVVLLGVTSLFWLVLFGGLFGLAAGSLLLGAVLGGSVSVALIVVGLACRNRRTCRGCARDTP